MARFPLPTLTIASGQTASTTVLSKRNLQNAKQLSIKGPATLPETVTVHVSNDDGATYGPLQSSGSDVTITQGDVIVINSTPFSGLKLVAGGAVAADRAFTIMGWDLI